LLAAVRVFLKAPLQGGAKIVQLRFDPVPSCEIFRGSQPRSELCNEGEVVFGMLSGR